MAHFRATIMGQSGKAVTRLGSKASGVVVKADGWNTGITVTSYVSRDGSELFVVDLTGGSNGGFKRSLVAVVDGEVRFYGE